MNNKNFLIEDKYNWYFPLNANYPAYLHSFLDKLIGKNETQSNEQRINFIQLLFCSLSLDIFDKQKIISRYSELSAFQIDEISKVFDGEKEKFISLEADFPETVKSNIIQRGIDWIFCLGLNNKKDALLNFIYHSDMDEALIKNCLHSLHEQGDSDEYIAVFENLKSSNAINEDHWNTYLYRLSLEENTDKLNAVKIPKKLASPFLKACVGSYLLRRYCLEKTNKRHIKNTLKYIKNEKREYVKYQFINDFSFYYLYKSRNENIIENLNKFIKRRSNTFVSTLTILNEHHEKRLITLERTFSYIFPIIFYFKKEQSEKIFNYLYLSLKRQLAKSEQKLIDDSNSHNDYVIEKFYNEKGEAISGIIWNFLLYKKFQPLYFLTKERSVHIKSTPLGSILIQAIYMNDDDLLKNNIEYYLNNGKQININDLFILYLTFYFHDKKHIADFLFFKYQEKNSTFQLKEVLDTLTQVKPTPFIVGQCFTTIENKINKNIKKYQLNSSLDDLPLKESP